jgi:UDP-N-acetyl-D-mannosaminuronic acid dehydrogenase
MKISILGLGYIGLPTSIILAKAGHDVYGFDVNKKVIDKLNTGKIHIVENNLQEAYKEVFKSKKFKPYAQLQQAEVYIIAVPTPFKKDHEEKVADLSYVFSATEMVAEILKEGDLVILESTVPPETTKQMTDILEEKSGIDRSKFFTAHCPERVLPGKILYELEHNDRVIGAERKESAKMAKDLYDTFVKEGTNYLTDDITAEMCKLVENTSRDVDIAFANELSIICDKLGVDVFKLIELANKHPRVNILNPGVGVGGHCIAVDPWFLVEKFPKESKLIHTARKRNDFKPTWVADKVEEEIDKDKSLTIGILGLAYKANVDDLRESPSIELGHILQERGYKVIGCEPYSKETEIKDIKNMSLDKVLEKSDYVVLTLGHDQFKENIKKIMKKELFNCIGLK